MLLDNINRQIMTPSKAENLHKRRKTRQDFYENPYQSAKNLFTEARSGTLDVPQEELVLQYCSGISTRLLHKTYSDPLKGTPLGEIEGLPVLDEQTTPFNTGGVRSKEVADLPEPPAPQVSMGCHISSTRIAHRSFLFSLVFSSKLGKKGLFLRSGAGPTECGFQRSRTQLALGASAQYLFSMLKAKYSLGFLHGQPFS